MSELRITITFVHGHINYGPHEKKMIKSVVNLHIKKKYVCPKKKLYRARQIFFSSFGGLLFFVEQTAHCFAMRKIFSTILKTNYLD